jgi:hypothetical protein
MSRECASDSFLKFRNCLLDTFRRCNEKDEYCELEASPDIFWLSNLFSIINSMQVFPVFQLKLKPCPYILSFLSAMLVWDGAIGEVTPQSRQSTIKLSLQLSELGLPHPRIRRRFCTLPPLVPGGSTLACGRGGGGVGPNSNEVTDTVVLLVHMYGTLWVTQKDFFLFSVIEFFIQVHCSDGKLSMQGLIFAYLCSYIDR